MTTRVCLFVLALSSSLATAFAGAVAVKTLDTTRTLPDLPLRFEENAGQAAHALGVQFISRGPGYQLTLSAAEASFQSSGRRVRMTLTGANAAAPGRGEDPLTATSSYFIGSDPAQWRSGIRNYGKVRYSGVFRGIDVVYRGNPGQLEYDFEVAPGADPGRIGLRFQGARAVRLERRTGDLVIETGSGSMRQRRPVAFQVVDGRQMSVDSGYKLLAGGRVGFRVGPYDRTRKLIIDPVVQFSTFFGGRLRESAQSVVVDREGNVYVAGTATSPDFPVGTSPVLNRVIGGTDIFVLKLNPSGTAVIYAAIVGGGGDESGAHLAVDALGNAYVAGVTRSINWPATAGVIKDRGVTDTDVDGFVFKLNALGSSLIYSTRVGGRGSDLVNGIAVDGGQSAYVTGETDSDNYPVVGGDEIFGKERKGTNDVFVSKLNVTGSAYVWSTLLGGDSDSNVIAYESGRGIAVDRNGNAYVAGITTLRDFPTTVGAFQRDHLGQGDGFACKISNDGKQLVWSTFMGGEQNDTVKGVALDQSFNFYIVGQTSSTRFPTTPQVVQPSLLVGASAPFDGFAVKLNASGAAVYSTFLGGSADDTLNAVAVDAEGNAYVYGTTASTDLRVTFNAVQAGIGRGITGEPYDSFLGYLNAFGTAMPFLTYYGGSRTDEGNGIARDAMGNLFLVGYTQSNDFRITPGALQRSTPFGTSTAFIARIGEQNAAASQLVTVSGGAQSGDEGAALRDPFVVELRDPFNNPVGGATVQFSATGATVNPAQAITDGRGRTQTMVTLGPRAGQAVITATFGTLAVRSTFTVRRVGPPLPEISAGGVVGAGLSTPAVRNISAGGLATIFGTNFAPAGTLRQVGSDDLQNGQVPASFAGVCVTVGGMVARVLLVSDRQVNIQVPELRSLGDLPVQVITNCGQVGELRSDPVQVELRIASPEFFYLTSSGTGRRPIAAVNGQTGATVGPAALGYTPARPGDVITVFGTGFGPTNPSIPVGEFVAQAAPTIETPRVLLDGKELPADHVLYAGAAPNQVGLNQLNFRVPQGVRNGRLSIEARFGLEATPQAGFLEVTGGLDLDPKISVSPERLEFGEVILGQTKQLPLTVANSGTFDLNINSINTGLPVFTVEPRIGFSLAPGESRVLTVRFEAQAVGPINVNLNIATTDPNQPLLAVPMSVTVVPVPPTPNPVPVLTGLSVSEIEAGAPGFNLVVTGSGFVRSSVVEVNGRPVSTQFGADRQLIAFVTATELVNPGNLEIRVFNPAPGGGRSDARNIIVRASVPLGTALVRINQIDNRFCPNLQAFVSVLGRSGLPINGLGNNELSCTEDGARVECTVQKGTNIPLSITIVVGLNGLPKDEDQLLLKSAIRQLLNVLNPEDRVQLYHLETDARQQIPFTTDRELILSRLDQLRPAGDGNALYDAVEFSSSTTRQQLGRRQIVLLFSAKGNIGGGFRDPNQALGRARAAGVPFFTVGLGASIADPDASAFLRQVARDTGGQFTTEANSLNFAALLNNTAQVVQGQYAVDIKSLTVGGLTKTLQMTFQTVEGALSAVRTYAPCLP